MSNMNLPDMWRNETALVEYLARQLCRGRLGLFLGAGISQFYGLPSWPELLGRLYTDVGESPPSKDADLVQKAQILRSNHYRGPAKAVAFKAAIKEALYRDVTLDFAKIRKNDTLAAIGSLVMASRRGSAARVITLNYDDLLENYLQYHGFTTATVATARHWAQDEDVVIYHPHGFLPLGRGNDSADIVFTTDEYLAIMSDINWRATLQTALRTHTFLYLGLSGSDLHMLSLWRTLAEEHAIADDRTSYHGVRFKVSGHLDEMAASLDDYRLFTHELVDYNALPTFLFRICQKARDLRMETL